MKETENVVICFYSAKNCNGNAVPGEPVQICFLSVVIELLFAPPDPRTSPSSRTIHSCERHAAKRPNTSPCGACGRRDDTCQVVKLVLLFPFPFLFLSQLRTESCNDRLFLMLTNWLVTAVFFTTQSSGSSERERTSSRRVARQRPAVNWRCRWR